MPGSRLVPQVMGVRPEHLAELVVFVDGLPGCGKTMLSPIVGAFPRVELLQYSYEIEYVCALDFLGLLDRSGGCLLARMLTDLKLYNTMMSRDTNFRRGDLSSVFMNSRPWRYLRRLFQAGNEHVIPRVARERPILHLATHHVLGFAAPIIEGLGTRAVIIEVIRHPLYMIRQQALYMDRYGRDVRDFTVWHTEGAGEPVPYFTSGWEDRFRSANAWERAVLFLESWRHRCDAIRGRYPEWWARQIIEVPFEDFVLNPKPYVERLEHALGTRADRITKRMMQKQRVPRDRIAAGLSLPIYRQYGWRPPLDSGGEMDELRDRRADAAAHVSPDILAILDRLSAEYEAAHFTRLPFWGRAQKGNS